MNQDIDTVLIRKIKRKEVKKAAKIMGDSFYDYPLYKVFFNDDKKRGKILFYYYWMFLYQRLPYTYVTDDLAFIGSIKGPHDKDGSLILNLLLHPCCLFGVLFLMRRSYLKMLKEFNAMCKPYIEKYYDKEKDWIIKAICVKKEARAGGLYFKAFNVIDQGGSCYAETHDLILTKLYSARGMKVVDSVEWQGITHYVLKRNN